MITGVLTQKKDSSVRVGLSFGKGEKWDSKGSGSEWSAGGAPEPKPGPPAGGGSFRLYQKKHGNFDRIAVLYFLCYDDRAVKAEGLSALFDDDW